MRSAPVTLVRLGLVVAAAACSHNPGPVATAPQRAPAPAGTQAPAPPPPPVPAAATAPSASTINVSGSWSGTVEYQGNTLGLDLTLVRTANGQYSGDVVPEGQTGAPLKSLTLDGNHLVMVFDAPEGEATFDMMLTADRQAFSGNISYEGNTIPFTARKRRN